MKATVPRSAGDLEGPTVTAGDDQFEVRFLGESVVLIEFHEPIDGADWIDTYQLIYCERSDDPETVKVVRAATDDERRRFRVPLFIQGDEIPECCGRPMFFVGQIDDDTICTEPPDDAKLWWHDLASFYVFTCSQCLEVKAIGQQM